MVNIKDYNKYFREMLFKLNNSDERSRNIILNIIKSLIVKVISTVVTLSLIPVSLHYIEKDSYGVWLTIASIITWFSIFDFGLSTGLTNRLTQAFADENDNLATVYLSTTYFILLVITIPLFLIYVFVSPFINWNNIFSTSMDAEILKRAVHITFASFVLLFILKPVISLLMARQKHFLVNIILVTSNLAALIIIYFIGPLIDKKFLFFSMILAFSYPCSILVFSIILYCTQYKIYYPRVNKVDLSQSRSLFGLSIKFFIIQVSVIIILTGNNFLIAHFVNNSNVTYYNIAYRLYSIVSIFQLMFLQPLWTGFTHAYSLKDFVWIRSVISKVNKMNFLLCLVLAVIFIMHKSIYRLWIGPQIAIPFEIDLFIFIYFIFYLFMQTYVYFINGIGTLNLQTILSIVIIVVQIPMVYILMEWADLGISGLLMLNIFWVILSLLLWLVQYRKIVTGTAQKRIWN